MEAQDVFYVVGTVALILFSVFLVFFFYVVYKLQKMARSGLKNLNFAARDFQNSLGIFAKSWGRVTAISLALKLIRSFFLRR